MENKSILYKIRRRIQVLLYRITSAKFMSKIYFRIALKYKLNLKKPKTLNEKLQWLKLYYWPNNKKAIQCADKLSVRDYIKSKKKSDLLNEILFSWNNVNEIDWEKLPKQFVIKCNHGCGYNIICKDKNKLDKNKVLKKIKKWMKEDFSEFNAEPHYSKIPRKIICEKYLGDNVINYNIYCFNGKAVFFSLAGGLGDGVGEHLTYYNIDGTLAKFKNRNYPSKKSELSNILPEMIKTAENLSKEFPMVRVDLFDVNGKIILSELTFTPGGALIPIEPVSMDKELGELLNIEDLIKNNIENKSKRIAIIGHFGGKENFSDGQTVKTKILYDELSSKTNWDIIKVDTFYKNKRPFKLFLDTIKCLLKTRQIIILLSGNGMKFYFPLLSFFSNKFNYKIYHDVIGGNLDCYVKKYPKYKKYLNSFVVNWVETNSLKEKLNNCEINNCDVIPNFKKLNINKNIKINFEKKFKFCTFSRVMKEKGIEDAIKAIKNINNKNKKNICILDIYGPIDEDYKITFDKIIKEFPSYIKYKGIVPYNESVNVIKKYYALLFPTYWNGEGFPGTIIDAFSSGIPVIATDWNCNSEIISDGVDGIIYPNKNIKNLEQAIEWSIKNKNELIEMKKNCIECSKKYMPESYIDKIIKLLK